MKIVNVTPGLLPIPPNGWGAVEKIIWEIHNNLLKLGHDAHIKYLNDISSNEYDIVHIHVANLALEAYNRGIPYYFTMHDHHSYLYGKESYVFKENYEAIKHSIKSFLPAHYLVDYFGLDNAMYFSHGVNTEYFKTENQTENHSILCVANNGYANNKLYDRKGFLPAIEAAKRLDLPITICGPEHNNKDFFNENKVDYNKLTLKYNLDEQQLKDEFKNHTIFLHLSELEAGHPNLTLLEAMASGLVVVGTLEKDTNLEGFYKVNRDIDETIIAIKDVIANYEYYREKSINTVKKLNWNSLTKSLLNEYKFSKETIRLKFKNNYDNPPKINKVSFRKVENKININFIEGPFVEINGMERKEYLVQFINNDNNTTIYETMLNTNTWARANYKYLINWKIKVFLENKLIHEHIFNCENKKVYIAFESKAIGDTLAWMPSIEEFRNKHKCKVVCSTFLNYLFEKTYPEIEFINPGETAYDLYAMFKIGWFYNQDNTVNTHYNPLDFRKYPLQKTATDILGLEYKEIRPKLDLSDITITKYNKKLALISIQSTTQAKYWNNPNGWNELTTYLKNNGYEVVCIDKYNSFGIENHFNYIPDNVLDWTGDYSLKKRIEQLLSADLFIGIGSGMSWLSWALGIKTVLISGFSEPYSEMNDCIRVTAPNDVCNGCYNNYRINASDWLWCPIHKGTNRQFECTKQITSEMVINKIKNII